MAVNVVSFCGGGYLVYYDCNGVLESIESYRDSGGTPIDMTTTYPIDAGWAALLTEIGACQG